MNYCKMFKDADIMDNDHNFFIPCSLYIDNNWKKSLEALFGVIEDVYTFNDFTIYLYDFIIELKNFYTEVGVNMGYFLFNRYFKKVSLLNFCDNDNIEKIKILNLNVYIDIIFNRIGHYLIQPIIENFFCDLQNKIYIMEHELFLESGVPKEAINFVLNSAELRDLSYFLIKTGFKCGFFLCLYFNTIYKQLSKESGRKLSPG